MQQLPDPYRRQHSARWGTPTTLLPLLAQQHQISSHMHVRHFLSGFAPETSKVYHERRLLGWSPDQLYEVVSQVDQYSNFVPWCAKSTVLTGRADSGYLEAELEVGFQVFVERYTSKVTLQRPDRVHSSVADSRLFDHLESTWIMKPGPQPGTTWLVFKVDFAFRSSLHRHVADMFFSEVVKRMMGAFEGRCAQLYGPSSLNCGGSSRHIGLHQQQPHQQQHHLHHHHHHPEQLPEHQGHAQLEQPLGSHAGSDDLQPTGRRHHQLQQHPQQHPQHQLDRQALESAPPGSSRNGSG